MAFINGKLDGEGNPYDVTTYSSNRRTEDPATTGQNKADRVCNIYDLEGNFLNILQKKMSSTTNIHSITGEAVTTKKISIQHPSASTTLEKPSSMVVSAWYFLCVALNTVKTEIKKVEEYFTGE